MLQVIAGSFLIDSDGCSIDTRPAASTGKLPTSLNAGLTFSTATLGSLTEFTGRYGSEINHVIQSPTDWSGLCYIRSLEEVTLKGFLKLKILIWLLH